jgi:hypothetical protein
LYAYVKDDPTNGSDPTGLVDINFSSTAANHGEAVHDLLDQFNPTNFYTVGGHADAAGGGFIQDQRNWTAQSRDFVALRAWDVYSVMHDSGYKDGRTVIAFGCHLGDSQFGADLARYAHASVITGHGFTAISTVKGNSSQIMMIAKENYDATTGRAFGPATTFNLISPGGKISAPIESIVFDKSTGKAVLHYATQTGSHISKRESVCVDKEKCGK